MSDVKFTKLDNQEVSIDRGHVLRTEMGGQEDTTRITTNEGNIEVMGSREETEAKLHGDAAIGSSKMSETELHGLAGTRSILNEYGAPEPYRREFRQPRDPKQMYADENYDQPVAA